MFWIKPIIISTVGRDYDEYYNGNFVLRMLMSGKSGVSLPMGILTKVGDVTLFLIFFSLLPCDLNQKLN